MPRIGIANGGEVAMPPAIQGFQEQIKSTREAAPSDIRENVYAGQRRKPDRAQR
jgi:hypothetical protein